MDPTALADLLTDELRAVARPERAEQEKRYLKSDLEFLGATVWEIRRVMKAFVKGATPLTHDGLVPLVERLLRESRTWALVDELAAHVVGGILARQPEEATAVLDRWATDQDFWIRRSSLLAELLPLRNGADPAPFLRRADAMLEEKEFFIRKAIGWVLREVGKRRPDEVAYWLVPRTHRASGVTMRETVRYLAAEDRDRLMAAYRERRPAT